MSAVLVAPHKLTLRDLETRPLGVRYFGEDGGTVIPVKPLKPRTLSDTYVVFAPVSHISADEEVGEELLKGYDIIDLSSRRVVATFEYDKRVCFYKGGGRRNSFKAIVMHAA